MDFEKLGDKGGILVGASDYSVSSFGFHFFLYQWN